MECHLYQKGSGSVVGAYSHLRALLTAVFVPTAAAHLSRPATAVGLTLHVRSGFQKSALQTTCFSSRLMGWREFHRLGDASRAACVGDAAPEPASSVIGRTATPRSMSRVRRWPAST